MDDLRLYDDCLVFLRSMWLEILDCNHTGRLRITTHISLVARPLKANRRADKPVHHIQSPSGNLQEQIISHMLQVHQNIRRQMVKLKELFALQSPCSWTKEWRLTYRCTSYRMVSRPVNIKWDAAWERMQQPTNPANLYPNVETKDRQIVEGKASAYRMNQQCNFDKSHE